MRTDGRPALSTDARATGAVSTWWARARSTALRNSVMGSALAMGGQLYGCAIFNAAGSRAITADRPRSADLEAPSRRGPRRSRGDLVNRSEEAPEGLAASDMRPSMLRRQRRWDDTGVLPR